MKLGRLGWLVAVGALLVMPLVAHAQNATLGGTITDNTGGVLPGVTVTVTNDAAGTVFLGVTDGDGVYSVLVRAGSYTVEAGLSGFTTVVRPDVAMAIGRTAQLDLELTISAIEETVTVTGEAPLLDVSTSTIAGNIDPRQMADLPLNGRNWMDLALLSPGARMNASAEVPQNRQGFFQINVDGQPVALTVCCASNQPRYSRDAIAEFEITTNRFDATQGRTMGMSVNAITKSGTNSMSGTMAGYFRHDGLNGKDFIQDRVLPYQNQQYSGTFGGPILLDRIHFFVNYEIEREPSTVTFSNRQFAGTKFNDDLPSTRKENKGGLKLDIQFNPSNRMSLRYNRYRNTIENQGTGGASSSPTRARTNKRHADQIFAEYSQVLSSNTVNQIKSGIAINYFTLEPRAGYSAGENRRPPNSPQVFVGGFGIGYDGQSGRQVEGGTPQINYRGYTIGSATNTPQRTGEENYSIRDDLTTSYQLGGRHDLKVGGEFIAYTMPQNWCNICDGQFTSNNRAPDNLVSLMPDLWDASTWDLDGMNAAAPFRDYTVSIGNFGVRLKRKIFAGWVQDDWHASNRLTLNLGVRYDFDHGAHGEFIQFDPWLSGNRPSDTNNIAPRLGFAYQADDRTVIRGGYGLFFTQLEDDALHQTNLLREHVGVTIPNDGRADFASSPFNGPVPTYDQALANTCNATNNAPGCYQRSITIEIPFGDHDTSYSHMGSIGVQRQVGDDMSFETNFVFTGGRAEERRSNANLSYNPATGANYRYQEVDRRPFPNWGIVMAEIMEGRSNYRGWENQFTRRFGNNWQLNASYTMSKFLDDGGIGRPAGPYQVELTPGADIPTRLVPLGFDVAADLRPDYGIADTNQTHRATLNGIWEIGKGLQLSGLYFYGSGAVQRTNYGGDNRNVGRGGTGRLRPDGTVAPRNGFVGLPLHRMDLRLQERIPLGGGATADVLLEVFNLFNHENYGSYTTSESNGNFGNPSRSSNNTAYMPRVMQIGFRLAF